MKPPLKVWRDEPRQAPPTLSKLVPRRSPGTSGRRPPKYPDLNFRDIAAAIDLNSTHVGRIMNGVCRPSIQSAQKLAAYLDWPMEHIASLYKPKKKK